MIKFLFALLLAAALIGSLVLFAVSESYFSKPSFFLSTLIFLVFSTALIFAYLYRAPRPQFFLQLYLLTMVVKLLAYCAYNLLMILKDKDSAAGNVIFFMITYFIFTILEIGFLYGKIAAGNER